MIATNGWDESGYVRVRESGARVKYWSYGHGTDVLLVLHGGPGYDHRYLESLRRFASGTRRVVLFDQLGSGESDSPNPPESWSIESFSDEVEQLRTGLDLGDIQLFGHSWGGFLALQYALTYPAAIRSLVLSNTSASMTQILQGWERIRAGWPIAVYAEARRREAHGQWDHPAYQDLLLRWFLAPHLRRNHPFDAATASVDILPLLSTLDVRGTARDRLVGVEPMNVTGTMIDWDVSARLAEISTPALVLTGAFDGISNECAVTIAQGLPDAQLVVLEESSHMMMHEHQAEVYFAAIRNFLDS